MIKAAVGRDLDPCRDRRGSKATGTAEPRCSRWKGQCDVGPRWLVARDKTRRAEADGAGEIGSLGKVQMFVFILRITSAQWLGFQKCFILSMVSNTFHFSL